ncbi:MAG TPA: hypothetical protein VJQ55_03905 [Candidatus Binatia bacterium]|nr:hypothetical protein [Candidatus Binatia bacterium]
MSLKTESRWNSHRVVMFLTWVLVLWLGFTATVEAKEPKAHFDSTSIDISHQSLKVIQSSPVISAGVKLGSMIIYDDPSTRRKADYLELYDNRGGLVAVSWFDRFGIQRIAVDRAFIDGEEKLEGVFVAVIDDSFI